jgi:hypothetical protein
VKRKRSPKTGPAEAAEIRRLLVRHAQPTLPAAIRERILAASKDAIRPLIEVLGDEDLASDGGPGRGWAPIHAARLLGDLAAAEAIEPLLKLMAETTWEEILHDAIIQALPKVGAAVVEPALRLYGDTKDPEVRDSVRAVLCEVGIRDDRILDIVVAGLEEEPGLGAMNLASYGEASALPRLHEAFDRIPNEAEGPFADQSLIELQDSIERLGGELTVAQRSKLERAMEARRRATTEEGTLEDDNDERMPVRVEKKLGRNDPCWCGSGSKYKKCHLAADEEAAVAASDEDDEAFDEFADPLLPSA